VKGPFDRGDSVNIVGPEGKAVACGVANYSASDLQRIKGRRSGEITQILGYHFGDEVIHPRQTRPRLIAALAGLETKRDRNPPKKHGNIPL